MTWEEITKLVQLAQAGDPIAYGQLVDQFQPTVYSLALARLRNANEAQELAQEVFVHVLTKLRQLRDPQCFAGWLRQITVRLAINRITRRAPLRGTESEVLDQVAGTEPTPLDEMVRAEQRTELWDGLRQLKKLDRETLIAFYIHGQTLQQMSREFETPVGTIKRRLHVARNRLREHLENPGRRKARRGSPKLACV